MSTDSTPPQRSSSPSAPDAKSITPKRSLRQRMGTAVRRSSSFLIPTRPQSPAAGSVVDDPMAAAGTTPASGKVKDSKRGRERSASPSRMRKVFGSGSKSSSVSADASTTTAEGVAPPAAAASEGGKQDDSKETPAKSSKPASVRTLQRIASVPLYMSDTASTAARKSSKDSNQQPPTPPRDRTSSESAGTGRKRRMSFGSVSLRSMRTKSSSTDKGKDKPVERASREIGNGKDSAATAAANDQAENREATAIVPIVPEPLDLGGDGATSTDVRPQEAVETAGYVQPQQDVQSQTNGLATTHGALSDSPRSLSTAPSQENMDAQNEPVSAPQEASPPVQDSIRTSPDAANPRVLAIKTSSESLGIAKELSPIAEDARSAEEERAYNQQFLASFPSAGYQQSQNQPSKPSGLAVNPPVVAQDFDSFSAQSGGTTPRPREYPRIETDITKGKDEDKDATNPAAARLSDPRFNMESAEGYFAPTRPMPLPAFGDPDEGIYAEDPFKDPEEPASTISTHSVERPAAGASTRTLESVPPTMPVPNPAQAPTTVTVPATEPVRSMPAPEVQPTVVNYPLPALNEVTHRDMNPGSVPSDYTLAARSSREASMNENERDFDADETAPLLGQSKKQQASDLDIFGTRAAAPTGFDYGTHNVRRAPSQPALGGWLTHSLPDTSTYYTHPTLRLVTDLNVKDDKVRDMVMTYVEEISGGRRIAATVPEGWEVWVYDEGPPKRTQGSAHGSRDSKKVEGKKDVKGKSTTSHRASGWREVPEQSARERDVKMKLARCWVNHGARAMGYWPPPAFVDGVAAAAPLSTQADSTANANGHARDSSQADDALDYAYRYYAFLESHPAHVALPPRAYHEALDALTWSYTERILKPQSQSQAQFNRAPSGRSSKAPPPFNTQEAQELFNILKSTSIENGDVEMTRSAARTRVVARVLRRMIQWKQHHFRPEKSLPQGTMLMPSHPSTNHHHALPGGRNAQSTGMFGRSALDIVLAWACLGLPYLYANRHAYWYGGGYGRYGIIDEEGGLMRSFGPMLIVGVGVCVVAAVIAVASLTLISLPGTDHSARTAAFLSIVFALFSLIFTLLSAWRGSVESQKMLVHGMTMGGRTSGEGRYIGPSASGTVLHSLPAAFVVYAILAFMAGIMLYVFRGSVVVPQPGSGSNNGGGAGESWTRIASYTRWTTVGVLGFCGGVLVTGMISVRR